MLNVELITKTYFKITPNTYEPLKNVHSKLQNMEITKANFKYIWCMQRANSNRNLYNTRTCSV